MTSTQRGVVTGVWHMLVMSGVVVMMGIRRVISACACIHAGY